MKAVLVCIAVAALLADKESAIALAILFIGAVLAAHWGIV